MRTTQLKGDRAVARAISRFTEMGYDVSIPLTESAAYDLVIDKDNTLLRIQVRYAGNGTASLRRIHSNAQGYVVKKITCKVYDWLYVLDGNGDEYIHRDCFLNRNAVSVSKLERLT